MKKTVIIILNWNGADDTVACLASLAAADGCFHVVVKRKNLTRNHLLMVSNPLPNACN